MKKKILTETAQRFLATKSSNCRVHNKINKVTNVVLSLKIQPLLLCSSNVTIVLVSLILCNQVSHNNLQALCTVLKFG